MMHVSMKRQTIILCFLACCLFTGMLACSYRFIISITGDDPFRPIFKLKHPPLITPFEARTPLNRFRIYKRNEEGEWDYKDPLWSFQVDLGTYVLVREIKYGELPKGFQETVASKLLSVDIEYSAVGSGGGCGGSVAFKIIEKDGSHEVIILDGECDNQDNEKEVK